MNIYTPFFILRIFGKLNLYVILMLVRCLFQYTCIHAQSYDYEQAYGFAFKDKSVFNKALPLGGGLVAVGQFNGRGVVAALSGNGEVSTWQVYDSLLSGHESNFTSIVFNELSSIAAGKAIYTVAGLCKECDPTRKGQSVILFRMGTDLKPIPHDGKLFTFLDPAIDSFDVLSNVELLVSANDLYVAFDGNSGFGSDIYLNKLDERTHIKIWVKQINTNFFEVPILLTNESPSIVGLALNGWGKNRIIKINPVNGSVMNQYNFNDIPGRFTYIYNGRYALAYPQDKTLQIRFIDSLGKITDSTVIKMYYGFSEQFAVSTFPFSKVNDASIGIVCHSLDSTELPYYHFKTSLYRINPSSLKTVYTFGKEFDNNGTLSRNIKQLILHSDNHYSMIGERLEDKSIRAFMVNSDSKSSPPTIPSNWYASDYCLDTSLIIHTSSKTYPHTLPFIQNNVVYDTKINFANKQQKLWMDIYRPYDHYAKSSTDKRPVLIYIAGGGYVASTEDISNFALQAAQRGMIAASIKYRVGIHPSFSGSLDSLIYYAPFALKAVYRALQDLRSSVKFLYTNAKTYNIDTSKIFLAGHSAGGNAVLNYAFLTEKEFPASYNAEMGPLPAKTPIAGIIAYEAPFSNTASIPVDPLSSIDATEKEPIYFIHGTCDSAAFFNTGNPFDLTSPYTVGAFAIACKKQILKQPYHLTTIKGGDHGLGPEEPLVMNSVFNWIKKKVACGIPNQECEIFTVPNASLCFNATPCPSCLVNPTKDLVSSIELYPNPASFVLTLSIRTNTTSRNTFQITILNQMGQVMMLRNRFISGNNEDKLELKIDHLAPGIYQLMLNNGSIYPAWHKSFIKL